MKKTRKATGRSERLKWDVHYGEPFIGFLNARHVRMGTDFQCTSKVLRIFSVPAHPDPNVTDDATVYVEWDLEKVRRMISRIEALRRNDFKWTEQKAFFDDYGDLMTLLTPYQKNPLWYHTYCVPGIETAPPRARDLLVKLLLRLSIVKRPDERRGRKTVWTRERREAVAVLRKRILGFAEDAVPVYKHAYRPLESRSDPKARIKAWRKVLKEVQPRFKLGHIELESARNLLFGEIDRLTPPEFANRITSDVSLQRFGEFVSVQSLRSGKFPSVVPT